MAEKTSWFKSLFGKTENKEEKEELHNVPKEQAKQKQEAEQKEVKKESEKKEPQKTYPEKSARWDPLLPGEKEINYNGLIIRDGPNGRRTYSEFTNRWVSVPPKPSRDNKTVHTSQKQPEKISQKQEAQAPDTNSWDYSDDRQNDWAKDMFDRYNELEDWESMFDR